MGDQDTAVEMINGSWWGVDSYTPATDSFGGSKTLYDFLLDTINFNKATKSMPETLRRPAFWGRYLMPSRNPLKPGGGLTQGEIEELHKRNCKILPVFNGNSPGRSQTFDEGRADADTAIGLACGLGIPRDVCIYLNVDSGFGQIKPEYILGWWTNMLGYAPNSLSGHVCYLRAGLYCALDIGRIYNRAFSRACGITNPWDPWKPKGLPEMEPLAPTMPFFYVWAGWAHSSSTVAGTPPGFEPPRFPCNPRGSHVWQYSTNRSLDQIVQFGNHPAQLITLIIQGRPMPVDLNIASQAGFDAMY